MRMFTHETEGYEKYPIYIAFKEYLDSCLKEKNFEKIISLLADDYHSLVADAEEVITSKEDFARVLRYKLDTIPKDIEYNAKSFYGKEITEYIWSILSEIDVVFFDGNKAYSICFAGCFRLLEEGFEILSTHISKKLTSWKKINRFPQRLLAVISLPTKKKQSRLFLIY